MKKIMNNPDDYVLETLKGLVSANKQSLVLDEAHMIVERKEKASKVALVSGGGSGHEPAHAGYVGKGMLDAAVAGNVFASPSAEQIYHAIAQADCGQGVLLIIKNYSGDIMNFTMAKELAECDGIDVEYVVVKDDVAVQDSLYSTGRRGIAGTVFVHKIAGAKAELGASLAEVKSLAERTIANVRSIGMAFSSCILPGVGAPGFTLGEDEMEIGMGIHGEPGIEKCRIQTAKELAAALLDRIMADCDYTGSEVALLVNGLGATPISELYIFNYEVCQLLAEQGIQVYRTFAGNYMTSLEMAGCSVSMLKLDEELKKLLDAQCSTPALTVS